MHSALAFMTKWDSGIFVLDKNSNMTGVLPRISIKLMDHSDCVFLLFDFVKVDYFTEVVDSRSVTNHDGHLPQNLLKNRSLTGRGSMV
jgi:hypothetical protein